MPADADPITTEAMSDSGKSQNLPQRETLVANGGDEFYWLQRRFRWLADVEHRPIRMPDAEPWEPDTAD